MRPVLLPRRTPQNTHDDWSRGRCARAYPIHAKTANTATRVIQR